MQRFVITRIKPYFFHILLVDRFGCLQKALSLLRLIAACPKDAQLVLVIQFIISMWTTTKKQTVCIKASNVPGRG